LLVNLKFSESEKERVVCQNATELDIQGFEAWVVGKIMAEEKINREAIFRALKSLCFDQCLFSMVPFVKGQDISHYNVNHVPFWVRIYNICLERMNQQVAINVRGAIGELLVIDWRDRDSC
ncbi:hypothetical protein Golob_006211, partial [Gossypium lobatum]|nr:hypothetical protein [Gossypium lobatum]